MLRRTLSLISASFIGLAAFSQPGAPDNGFAGDGTVVFGNGDDYLFSSDLLVRPNGNIVIIGSRVELEPTVQNMAFAEFDTDGILVDQGFFGAPGREHFAKAAALQADGKFILAGYSFPTGDDTDASIELMRIDATGALDETFGDNGVVLTDIPNGSEGAFDMSILPNGKIVVAGSFFDGGTSELVLAQYLANGALDAAGFGSDGLAFSTLGTFTDVDQLVVTASGNILVSGMTFTDTDAPYIMGFLPNGNINTAFGDEGLVIATTEAGYAYSTSIALEATGTVLLGVNTDPYEIHRFTSTGQPGTGLGTSGSMVSGDFIDPDQVIRVLAQPDGRILVGYTTNDALWQVERRLANGQADGTFQSFTSPNGPVYFSSLALQPDGKVLVGGDGSVNLVRAFAVTRLLNELTVGLTDLDLDPSTTLVYPNPLTDEASFTFTVAQPAAISLFLTDVQGRIVRTFTSNSTLQAGDHTQVLDLLGLASGAYQVVLMQGDMRTAVQDVKD